MHHLNFTDLTISIHIAFLSLFMSKVAIHSDSLILGGGIPGVTGVTGAVGDDHSVTFSNISDGTNTYGLQSMFVVNNHHEYL